MPEDVIVRLIRSVQPETSLSPKNNGWIYSNRPSHLSMAKQGSGREQTVTDRRFIPGAYATLPVTSMMPPLLHVPRSLTGLALGSLLLLAGCGMFSEQTLVKDSPNGGVYLQRLSNRGTTARYSGPLKAFQASHPVTLAPEHLAKALAGIRVGILPADQTGRSAGIKPTPLLTAHDIAFLAPAIAGALQQATSDQRVKFQVGPDTDRTEGTLYVDGAAIRIALARYHGSAHSRDEQLSIYTLSFKPEQAQLDGGGPQSWLDIEPDQPRLAIALDALASLSAPPLLSVAPSQQEPARPALSTDTQNVNEVVRKQAQELDALKAELEAIKKQLGSRPAPATPAPSPQ